MEELMSFQHLRALWWPNNNNKNQKQQLQVLCFGISTIWQYNWKKWLSNPKEEKHITCLKPATFTLNTYNYFFCSSERFLMGNCIDVAITWFQMIEVALILKACQFSVSFPGWWCYHFLSMNLCGAVIVAHSVRNFTSRASLFMRYRKNDCLTLHSIIH